ncbi:MULTISPECIES: homoserine O-acetyltransferase [unclassified Oleiphilus]|jgi:homoserine O-acetyltransferase|nr:MULTISPECIES: homoserine O-acetyltransferase [unclassified Oleiphilus]KZY78120.1 homoserine O-acetyltransferase [Oleiphilus sp. HI0068]KZY83296.1 homoserine O-acetyltransferase [Oleiphilus sp. HI0069]KZY95929.1 homoserine O-acetyltransferase [Oleiphilus sp. HI0072]KZZ22080.1 homoserine O-acetyltransferase [Oleiphilus sp. HI0081]KZY39533.1 homoserine O-acetyltransferase [Oleiphilus sp. HI0043]
MPETASSSPNTSNAQAMHSVGIVEPKVAHFDQALNLISGKTLQQYELVYETYGELNENRTNAILICHALSGDHHAAGFHSESDKKPGWWDSCIGPDKPIDTNRFFVVSLNNLGGCSGSTGPNTINPETGELYGPDFPIITVDDWVESQARLADRLDIDVWAAVVGGSLGGMQALAWSLNYPERLKHAVVIASTPKLTAQNIAFNEISRKAITSDPDFHQGHYYSQDTIPSKGLMLARMIGHVTYLSDASMGEKFGRDLKEEAFNFGYDVEFEVESYLNYQGERFSKTFDANTYLLMTRALDYFDPAEKTEGSLEKALGKAQCGYFVVSFSTDWRFSPERSERLVEAMTKAGKRVCYAEVDSEYGHDAFLIPTERYMAIFSAYMKRIAEEIK